MAFETLRSIKSAFWLANAQEACERLAYFGIRAVLPLMMVSFGAGGLGLSMAQKGIIYGVWAIIQCLVPMVSGGFSESFGYKKSLIVAFIINAFGYLLMGNILNIAAIVTSTTDLNNTLNFWLMMFAGGTIGLGTALFKPPVQGMVAKSLNEKNSGFGFGLFYWVVNVGGFLAPMAASALRGTADAPTWHYVFYSAAGVTIFNLLITLFFFKEPERSAEEIAENKKKTLGQVFVGTIKTLLDDKNMLVFLLIVSGFWLMFMQLWDLLPNFIDEWVDRRQVGEVVGSVDLFKSLVDNGALKPEMIINIDAAAIILFVLPISALFARYKMMTALVLGMVISVVGFILSGVSMSGAVCCLGVFVFAIGEIICSPKFSEYIGMTAPADKKAIYMGFSNIPFAVGWAFGNFLSGPLYQVFSSKEAIARNYLATKGFTSNELATLNLDQLMLKVQDAAEVSDTYEATRVLWDFSDPWIIWIFLGAIGVISMIGMIAFYYRSGMAEKDAANSNIDKEEADMFDTGAANTNTEIEAADTFETGAANTNTAKEETDTSDSETGAVSEADQESGSSDDHAE